MVFKYINNKHRLKAKFQPVINQFFVHCQSFRKFDLYGIISVFQD